jgi:hypothetical protein
MTSRPERGHEAGQGTSRGRAERADRTDPGLLNPGQWPWAAALLIAVLGVFGIAVSIKAAQSVAPPLYDSLSYFWKACSLWQEFHRGNWGTMLASTPQSRPPGLLALYAACGIGAHPFSFQAFFAVCAVVPVLIWSAACLLAIPPHAPGPSAAWRRAALVSGLALLPMFLRFEFDVHLSAGSYWGMQDTALAAVSALAVALLTRALDRRSHLLAAAGFFLSGFSVMIKPAGILVMAACLGVWTCECLVRCGCSDTAAARRAWRSRLAAGIACAAVTQGTFLLLAATSPYLSREVVQASLTAQGVVIDLSSGTGIMSLLADLGRTALGPVWATLALVAVPSSAALLLARARHAATIPLLRIGFAALVLVLSCCWWFRMAGPIPRYMFPFACMAMILCLPAVWRAWELCGSRAVSAGALAAVLAIALGQVALVASPWPIPDAVQRTLGICLHSGRHGDSVSAGRHIVACSEGKAGTTTFMPASMHERLGLVGSWLVLRNLESPSSFRIVVPHDWVPDNMLLKERVLSADVFAVDLKTAGPLPDGNFAAKTLDHECWILNSWLAGLDSSAGIDAARFGAVRVLHVTDRATFARELRSLVLDRGYAWRPAFAAQWADDR